MVGTKVECAFAGNDLLGESPWWDPCTTSVLWVDIRTSLLRRFDLEAETVTTTKVPEETTAVVGASPEGVLLIATSGVYHLSQHAQPVRVTEGWLDRSLFRTNDAATDTEGRLWVGWFSRSRAQGAGAIGVISPMIGNTDVLTGLTLPNGIGFTADGRTMYYVDTGVGTIWATGYNPVLGQPTEQARRFAVVSQEEGLIDGIAIDREGGVWAALWGAGAVVRYSERGRIDDRIHIPTPLVTNCVFAGIDRHVLYITTAGFGEGHGNGAGGLYRAEVGIGGMTVSPGRLITD